MYADDTTILYSSKSVAEINEAINSDLKRLQIWLGGNKLSLNVAKTQSMILGSSSNLKKHHMNNGDPKIDLYTKMRHRNDQKPFVLPLFPSQHCKRHKSETASLSRKTTFPAFPPKSEVDTNGFIFFLCNMGAGVHPLLSKVQLPRE